MELTLTYADGMKMKWDLQICFQLSKHGDF